MSRDREWLRKLAEAYADSEKHTDLPLDDEEYDDPDDDRETSIICQVLNFPRNEPEECWQFLLISCELDFSNDHLGLLGAGIFEDLMDEHGPTFIDRVEEAFSRSESMRVIVKAVWTYSMEADIARRIKIMQGKQSEGGEG